MDQTTYCPHCGGPINMVPKPDAPGRVWGFCPAYRFGPVVEMDATHAETSIVEPAPYKSEQEVTP